MAFQRTNSHLVGNVGITIGTLLILMAILILFVNFRIEVNRDWLGNVTSASWVFPNLPYSIGIGVVGIVFCAFGSASRAMKPKQQIQPQPPPPFSKTPSFCRYCGTQNTPNAVFCSKCGEKLT